MAPGDQRDWFQCRPRTFGTFSQSLKITDSIALMTEIGCYKLIKKINKVNIENAVEFSNVIESCALSCKRLIKSC